MNLDILIDAIVRQTTVMIAQLATATGSRARLAHTANQVFIDLVTELKAQGMTNPVIADMFGLALRTYHKKLQRLTESATFRGVSLWTAVLQHVSQNGPTLRADVLQRFSNDDETTLRGVLNDLVEGGLLYGTGTGERTLYRALDDDTPRALGEDLERVSHLVWVAIYRFGPLDLAGLRSAVPATDDAVNAALGALLVDGRVRQSPTPTGLRYSCDQCFIPVGSSEGWEAAVYDHYQAVVTTICRKLALRTSSAAHDHLGGSTFRFTVWPGHPQYERVKFLLKDLRVGLVALRQEVEEHNRTHSATTHADYEHYLAYAGQAWLDDDN